MRICDKVADYVRLVYNSYFPNSCNFSHHRVCINHNHKIINKLNYGRNRINESGVNHIMNKNWNNGCLTVITDIVLGGAHK